jgi:hypothetical protein
MTDRNRSIDVEEQQRAQYADYHELCRRTLNSYFGEDPDRNWNYIDRLRRIWEAGNTPSSILAPEMRIRLINNRDANTAVRRLYNFYDTFPIGITDNFETPRRNIPRPRVSF